MTELKPRRRIKVLLLVEVEVGPDWGVVETPDGPAAVGNQPGTTGNAVIPWTPDAVAGALGESLVDRWPDQGPWWPWRVRSAKQAVAP